MTQQERLDTLKCTCELMRLKVLHEARERIAKIEAIRDETLAQLASDQTQQRKLIEEEGDGNGSESISPTGGCPRTEGADA